MSAPEGGHVNQAVVVAKELLTDRVIRVTLSRPDHGRLPDWTPGAHIDLHLENGLVRQYSLCGDRWDTQRYQIAVLRETEGKGGSLYVHDSLDVGDIVEIGGPRNNFPLYPAEDYIFIAGGIGITPLLPMIKAAERLEVPWRLVYTGRTRDSISFADELAAYGDRVLIHPRDELGRHDLDATLAQRGSGTQVYACGPAQLLADLKDKSQSWSNPDALHTELFQAAPLAAPARATGFQVRLDRRGALIDVGPDESVLDALRGAGAHILSSCGVGTCGTCEVGVLDGVPDHRDSILSERDREANDCMFVCVSRALSDTLVVDL
ncbi:PDR/VanB family oxidoreductase [Pseudarthrobacter siccitolerans]